MAEQWEARWIIIENVVQGKQVLKAVDFAKVRSIEADSKLSSSKLKRFFTLIFDDGTTFEIPIEAKVKDAPLEYKQLIARLSRGIQVE